MWSVQEPAACGRVVETFLAAIDQALPQPQVSQRELENPERGEV